MEQIKKINIPIGNIITATIPANVASDKVVFLENGRMLQKLDTWEIGKSSETLGQIRENASLIIWYAISVEQDLDTIIADYFFGPVLGTAKPKRDFFLQHVLQADIFTFAKKKTLVNTIIQRSQLLSGKDNNLLATYIAKVMRFRNAFAHGKLSIDTHQVSRIEFFSGEHKTTVLDNAFWAEIEKECGELDNILRKVKSVFSDRELGKRTNILQPKLE